MDSQDVPESEVSIDEEDEDLQFDPSFHAGYRNHVKEFVPDEDRPRLIRQSKLLQGGQIKNDAGGDAYRIAPMELLRRFLVLGYEGGSYYVKEQELQAENAAHVIEMIEKSDGMKVLDETLAISEAGRAAKRLPAIYCLALCARYRFQKLNAEQRDQLRQKAYDYMLKICKIPTDLFEFISQCQKMNETRGWGRAHRSAISSWYLRKEPRELAYLMTKYGSRKGWTHLDVLRKAHPKVVQPEKYEYHEIFSFAKGGFEAVLERRKKTPMSETVASDEAFKLLQAVDRIKKCKEEAECACLIKEHRLVRELVPTKFLKSAAVWKSLLPDMPFNAMIRCLNRLTMVGLITEDSEETNTIVSRLDDIEYLRRARIHPMQLFVAWIVYKQGVGVMGCLAWQPAKAVVDAFERAFYNSFSLVEPTNQRFCIGLDISGSMSSPLAGSCVTAAQAAAALVTMYVRLEPKCEVVAFSHNLDEIPVDKNEGLEEFMKKTVDLPMLNTDCALPMLWAANWKKEFDVFVIFTDNETYFGSIHPVLALNYYRDVMGIREAKLIDVGMTTTNTSIADPNDRYMLDVVGFDPNITEIMPRFITNDI